eukprot:TRINITY_DN6711_c0_g1_i4.p1 TRINITY_DN6711_c0_g1~~TRINITY_DN6711_c0_g1_i4.p1  ORF type:complete len:437 (-),score=98.63 TRINITY_DN6711_c0_g1_i4:26-1336(-)
MDHQAIDRTQYPFLRGSEQNSFAEKTLSERVPNIGKRTLNDNKEKLTPESFEKIKSLIEDLPHGNLRAIEKRGLSEVDIDVNDWNEFLQPFVGSTWLEVPWYVAESYFYRRLVEATDPIGLDLFDKEKKESLEGAATAITRLAIIPNPQPNDEHNLLSTFLDLTFRCLWANRADLSLWKPGDDMLKSAVTSNHEQDAETVRAMEEKERQELKAKVIVDDSMVAWNFIKAKRSEGELDIGFICDNCGIEIAADLRFADFLLETGLAKRVTLHLKLHPFFVSDAMPKDAKATIDFVKQKHHESFGTRLQQRLDKGDLVLENDPFWTSAKLFEEMPSGLRSRLSQHSLVISKGDANYRRLAGERRYPHTLPFGAVAVGGESSSSSYFPVAVLALRTCKADIAVGIPQEDVDRVSSEDPQWLVNGQWGLIQFAIPLPQSN